MSFRQFYMSRYLSMFSPVKEAVEYAWAVMVRPTGSHVIQIVKMNVAFA